MPEPLDIAVEYTLGFVQEHLKDGGQRLLEVGGGDGRLAARLRESGRQVVLLDSDAEQVRAAAARGVDARCVGWPDYADPERYQAVLFTRSLHHISPLDAAVQRAAEALTPDGRIIVEDFAFDEVDGETAAWLQGRLRELCSDAGHAGNDESFAAYVLAASQPLAAWREHHEAHGPLHTAAEIRSALGARLAVRAWSVPYLFRYACAYLSSTAAAPCASGGNPLPGGKIPPPAGRRNDTGSELQRFLEDEQAAISAGRIRSIGRRYVATLPAAESRLSAHDYNGSARKSN